MIYYNPRRVPSDVILAGTRRDGPTQLPRQTRAASNKFNASFQLGGTKFFIVVTVSGVLRYVYVYSP